MEVNNISIGIGGEAGAGVMESGLLLSKFALRSGLFSFIAHEYPSRIRGGHNFTAVQLRSGPVYSQFGSLDLLIALNGETLQLHESSLRSGSGVILDSDKCDQSALTQGDINTYAMPLSSIAKEAGGPDLIRNTAALGAAIALLNGDLAVFEGVVRDVFSPKGNKIVTANLTAARKGYEFAHRLVESRPFGFVIESQSLDPNRLLLSGNDALSLGALKAGVKFVAIYPMTPITSILEFLAAQADKYNLVVKEPEDEISAINMAIGASYAGARSLTASSGGGFCLMTEGLSLSGATETPLVVVEGMRGGPSTGLPTQTEQSDLRFVLHAGHGEFPRVVVAPGDPEECFTKMFEAFNLADKYQLPVLVITDKHLGSSIQTVSLPDSQPWKIDRGKEATSTEGNYARYALSEDGISPRALPGCRDAVVKVTSYEHDEYGQPTEDPSERSLMVEKRMKKIEALAKELPEPTLHGSKEADLTIIGWGSTKGAIFEAVDCLAQEGITANFLQLTYLEPFPAYTVASILDHSTHSLLVENSYTGQMAGVIREKTGRHVSHQLLRHDGRPFLPEDIIAKVKEIIVGSNKRDDVVGSPKATAGGKS